MRTKTRLTPTAIENKTALVTAPLHRPPFSLSPSQARMEEEQRVAQRKKALREAAEAARDRARAARAAADAEGVALAEAEAIAAGAAAGEVRFGGHRSIVDTARHKYTGRASTWKK